MSAENRTTISQLDEDKMKATSSIAIPGLNKFELMEEYKKWHSTISYDKVVQARGYNGPRKTAYSIAQLIAVGERKSYRIIDVGAGTGIVGEELQKMGFETLDALEPSQDLSKTARSKNIYNHLFNCFMAEKITPALEKDTYDGLVSCGCFMENHLPVKALDEMVRIVKSGGVIVITTRLKYLETVEAYKDKLEAYMDQLETRGKWVRIQREVFPNYYQQDQGIVWVYRVL